VQARARHAAVLVLDRRERTRAVRDRRDPPGNRDVAPSDRSAHRHELVALVAVLDASARPLGADDATALDRERDRAAARAQDDRVAPPLDREDTAARLDRGELAPRVEAERASVGRGELEAVAGADEPLDLAELARPDPRRDLREARRPVEPFDAPAVAVARGARRDLGPPARAEETGPGVAGGTRAAESERGLGTVEVEVGLEDCDRAGLGSGAIRGPPSTASQAAGW
jgi:hypothetical protein